MGSLDNLIPLNKRPKEEADAIRAKALASPKRGKNISIALKKKYLKQKSPLFAFLMSLADTTDPHKAIEYYLSHFDALEKNIIEGEKEGKDTFFKRTTLMQRYNDFLKFRYGEVHKNINLNINTTADEVMKRLKEAKQKLENDISN